MKKIALLVAMLAVVVSLECVTTGPGGRQSLIIVSDVQEVEIGQQVDAEVRGKEKIYGDAEWQRYLTEVGQRIVRVSDRQEIEYHFTVIESDQINAFATPGGYVYFYTGILNMMDNEAEMAAVMAHEISHVVGRHSVKHLQTAMGASVLLQIVLGERSEGAWGQVAGIALGVGLTGYGRGHELEADEFGVHYMQKAGYNPDGARTMFTKLAELSGGDSDRGFFESLTSSHPETQERLSKIDAQIAAMPRSVDNLPRYEDRYKGMKKRFPPPPKK
jgi:predicted Zn-dependent protease